MLSNLSRFLDTRVSASALDGCVVGSFSTCTAPLISPSVHVMSTKSLYIKAHIGAHACRWVETRYLTYMQGMTE